MERSFPTPTPPRLELRVPAGHITVRTREGAETTEVRVSDDREDRWDVDLVHGSVVVRRRNSSGRGSSPSIDIDCPQGTSIDAQFASADLEARGTYGTVQVKTASGDVDLERAEGRVVINTVSGDVMVGHTPGHIDVHTVSGDQVVHELGPGAATFTTVSGDVSVAVAPGIEVWLDLQSVAGETASDLMPSAGPAAGEAGPMLELRMHSVSGDLTVVRAAATAA